MLELDVFDGPAGAGKETIARMVAERKGVPHIDSGLLYRAIGIQVFERSGEPIEDVAASVRYKDIDPGSLRNANADRRAAEVAKNPNVRKIVNAEVIRVALESGGAIVDGRANAFEYPEARVRIYLYAELHVCADRRYSQVRAKKEKTTYGEVMHQMQVRNQSDQDRLVHPLLTFEKARASGVYTAVIDSTRHRDEHETFAKVLTFFGLD